MISAALSILFLASAALAQSPACARTYTVQDGDYCDLISAANNASTYQLAEANYQTINDACTNLQVGQQLCLGNVGSDCQTTYVVKQGDYCDLISQNNAINTTLLMTNNPQIDDNCYNLYIGEVLCVADSVLVTPPPAGWALPGSSLELNDVGTSSDVASTSASVVPASQPTTTTIAAVTSSLVVPADNNVIVTSSSTTSSSYAAPSSSSAPTDDTDTDTGDYDDGSDDYDDCDGGSD